MFSFKPVIGGSKGVEPVAFTTKSGFNVFTKSTVASLFLKIIKFLSLEARLIR